MFQFKFLVKTEIPFSLETFLWLHIPDHSLFFMEKLHLPPGKKSQISLSATSLEILSSPPPPPHFLKGGSTHPTPQQNEQCTLCFVFNSTFLRYFIIMYIYKFNFMNSFCYINKKIWQWACHKSCTVNYIFLYFSVFSL